jgi:outer membrane protein TolC
MIPRRIVIVTVLLASPAVAQDSPAKLISKEDAIRIALAYNQSLRANRLNVDQGKANEITAGLKPNPTLSLGVDAIPIFMPQTIRWDTQIYSGSVSYTVEKGGKSASWWRKTIR